MMTLPSPRYKYYQHKSFATIKSGVLDYADEIIKDLGNFQFFGQFDLLGEM